jgi:CRISPR-associated protein Csm3
MVGAKAEGGDVRDPAPHPPVGQRRYAMNRRTYGAHSPTPNPQSPIPMNNDMFPYQLHEKLFFQGFLTTVTGLVIGGSDTALSIGGLNKTVIRDPATGKPFIPGSSIKGKLRSLLELSAGCVGGPAGSIVHHGPCMDPGTDGAALCGTAIDRQLADRLKVDPDLQRPSPLLVRDAYLLPDQVFKYADLGYTHTKTEVCIDRITAKANPRTLERVPPGARFRLDLVLNIFREAGEDDAALALKTERLVRLLYKGLQLLQDDYLGGNGSRGSGQVHVQLGEVYARSAAWYRAAGEERPQPGEDATARFPFLQALTHAPA